MDKNKRSVDETISLFLQKTQLNWLRLYAALERQKRQEDE